MHLQLPEYFPIGAGLGFNYFLHGKFKVLDNIMPVFSMLAIELIIVVITAAGRNDLMVVGPMLLLAVFIHNMSGYFLARSSKGRRTGRRTADR